MAVESINGPINTPPPTPTPTTTIHQQIQEHIREWTVRYTRMVQYANNKQSSTVPTPIRVTKPIKQEESPFNYPSDLLVIQISI